MLDVNVLNSYLVKLGFATDQPSYRHFEDVLKQAESKVEEHTGGILQAMLKMQLGIVGVFTGISAAVVAMIEHVSMADQKYRLLGTTMLASAETAKKLEMIQKQLGVTQEDVLFDQTGELQGRWNAANAEFNKLTTTLGADYKVKLRAIRDIIAQVQRFGTILEFLQTNIVLKLYDSMGGFKKYGDIIQHWMDWFSANQKHIADIIGTRLVPVLTKTWEMLEKMGHAALAFSDAFSNIIGRLFGDDTILKSTDHFEKLALALGHVADAAGRVFDAMTNIEEAISKAASGHPIEAMKSLTPDALRMMGGTVVATLIGGAAVRWLLGAIGGAIGGGAAAGAAGAVGAAGAAGAGGLAAFLLNPEILAAIAAAVIAVGAYTAYKTWKGDWFSGKTAVGTTGTEMKGAPSGDDLGISEDSPGNPTLHTIARAMSVIEGFDPAKKDSLASKNKNPWNLIYNSLHPQEGATPGEGSSGGFPFAKFDTKEHAANAALKQMTLNIERGHNIRGDPAGTLGEFVKAWDSFDTPERQTNYVKRLSAMTGIGAGANMREMTHAGNNVNITLNGGVTVENGGDPKEVQSAIAGAAKSAVQTDLLNLQPMWFQN